MPKIYSRIAKCSAILGAITTSTAIGLHPAYILIIIGVVAVAYKKINS